MKKGILLVFFASSLIVAQAQIKFGAKAGLNIAGLAGDDADDFKSKLGFNLGGFVEVPIAENFTVKPELMYSGQGAKFDDDDIDSKFALGYLNVPILGKYTSSSGFFGETGPQLGFLLSAKAKTDEVDVDVKDNFKGIDFGWAFGIGYEMAESGFGVNARYNLGLSSIADDDDGDVSVKNSVFQIGVFKTFGGGASARRR
ncbi:MAG: PorT family protein [Chitinophagaceae bacterium]|nr:PorT family protein [Chitinophagaceae bacterium]